MNLGVNQEPLEGTISRKHVGSDGVSEKTDLLTARGVTIFVAKQVIKKLYKHENR
jgi:hypothetical protein